MKNPARKTFEPMLSPYVDGELSVSERQSVEAHLSAEKESAAQVADFRAAQGLIRLSLEVAADEEDFKDFANQVMARITPEKLPLFERLSLSLSELFLYKRPLMVTSFATAAVVALVAVPLAMKLGASQQGYANPRVEVQTVSVEQNATVRPVVMETDKGDAIIWMVEDPSREVKKPVDEEAHEENDADPSTPLGAAPSPKPKKSGDL